MPAPAVEHAEPVWRDALKESPLAVEANVAKVGDDAVEREAEARVDDLTVASDEREVEVVGGRVESRHDQRRGVRCTLGQVHGCCDPPASRQGDVGTDACGGVLHERRRVVGPTQDHLNAGVLGASAGNREHQCQSGKAGEKVAHSPGSMRERASRLPKAENRCDMGGGRGVMHSWSSRFGQHQVQRAVGLPDRGDGRDVQHAIGVRIGEGQLAQRIVVLTQCNRDRVAETRRCDRHDEGIVPTPTSSGFPSPSRSMTATRRPTGPTAS